MAFIDSSGTRTARKTPVLSPNSARMKNRYHVSTDKSKLDYNVIHSYLTNSYWAEGRTMEEVKASTVYPLCFGVYTESGEQVAFTRVVTDFFNFAYLSDMFVVPEHEGKGAGKLLLRSILTAPQLSTVKRFMLHTRDAAGFYQSVGFKFIDDPEKWLELKPKL